VTAPDGREWTVRRLWLPRRRWRGPEAGDDAPLLLELGDIPAVGIVFVVLAVVLAVLAALPFVIFALELVLLVPVLVAYRVLRGKPWTVEARSGSEVLRWPVRGWRRSGEAVGQVARSLELGERPEPNLAPG
jgi:hypothetical protein